MTEDQDLEADFDSAMRNVYRSALSECGYAATRFMQLVESEGGIAAAKQLLHTRGHSDGLTKLWELKRLDISMEALVLESPWCTLFTEEELATAKKRLSDLGYT